MFIGKIRIIYVHEWFDGSSHIIPIKSHYFDN